MKFGSNIFRYMKIEIFSPMAGTRLQKQLGPGKPGPRSIPPTLGRSVFLEILETSTRFFVLFLEFGGTV